jgi:hypothetical protein
LQCDITANNCAEFNISENSYYLFKFSESKIVMFKNSWHNIGGHCTIGQINYDHKIMSDQINFYCNIKAWRAHSKLLVIICATWISQIWFRIEIIIQYFGIKKITRIKTIFACWQIKIIRHNICGFHKGLFYNPIAINKAERII